MNNITIFLGKNLKDFVVSIFLKFVLYMSMLIILLIFFFSAMNKISDTMLLTVIIVFPILANIIISKKIIIKHDLRLMIKYPHSGNNNEGLNYKIPDMKNFISIRRTILEELNKIIHVGYITLEFRNCFSIVKIVKGEFPAEKKEEILELYKDHIKQLLFKIGVNLLTILIFFSISILFTIGYKSPELLFVSSVMALIFYFFIRSAIIIPLFSLITLEKITEKLFPD